VTGGDDLAIDDWNDAREIRQAVCRQIEMAEISDKEAWTNEARGLVARLVTVKHRLAENECEFVLSLEEKLNRYGAGAFVSEKQMNWLRILDRKLTPDERQMSLL
jgi:hypothetical protein